ncbi:unnamed protein product, partial [Closterium sp. Naga37s-1]
MEVLVSETRPDGADAYLFRQLVALKQDVMRTAASMKKRKPQATLDLEAKYRHYDKMVMLAEEAVLTGRLPSLIDPKLLTVLEEAAQDRRQEMDLLNSHVPTLLSPSQSARPRLPAASLKPIEEASAGLEIDPKLLTPIEEASAGLEIDPKLLTVLEEAAQDRRQELDLQGHHFKAPLAYLPESVALLDWIVELRLANNGLVVLPQAIGNLFCLSVLDASCNKLVEVPESIGHLAKLRVLDLHHNYLEELPTSIGHCEALEELRLGFNSLTGLPEAICKLSELKLLSAPLNQLTYVPRRIGNLEKLTDLDVHYNSLQSIPESIGRLERLTSLNISANHYHLKELPETLGNLRSLVKLDISENYIKILPVSFVNLTSLKKLSLQGNPWQHPPMDVVNSGLQAFCVALSTALSQFRDVLACLDVHRHSPLLAALPPAPLSASSLLPAAGGSARREGQERQQQQQRWRQEGRGEEERKGAESESVALRTGVSEARSAGRDESGGAAPGLREGGLAAGDAAGRVGHGGHREAGRGRQEQRGEYLRLRHLLAFLSPWFVRLECLVSFIDECRSVGTGTGTHGC